MALNFEDIKEGMSIAPLVKKPGYQQLVKWAYAQGNLGETHYDRDYARSQGLPDAILQGPLMGAFFGQAVEDWAGHVGRIRRLSWRNQAMGFPGDSLTTTGKVEKTYVEKGEGLVECSLEMRSQRQEVVLTGRCTISIPMKKAPTAR